MSGLFRDSSHRTTTTTQPPQPPSPYLSSPFSTDLTQSLSSHDLRTTAYEIFVAACRTSSGKPLSSSTSSAATLTTTSTGDHSGKMQKSLSLSLTSTAASRVKKLKALGLRSLNSSLNSASLGLRKSSSFLNGRGSGGGGGGGGGGEVSLKMSKPVTVGELMRVQMRVSENVDSRIRKAFLRIAASQLGKRIDNLVLPLELLEQLKSSDFTDQQEYEEWKKRNLRVLEAGLILHPYQPFGKADASARRLQKIIHGALERPIETGKNNESMQVMRSAVVTLACRGADGLSDSCHWADGFPLNLCLYEMLLEACFDTTDEASIIEEVDELIELIKKTWSILGINQMLHNLCFAWVVFNHFVATGHVETELLSAVDGQLEEVAKDAKTTKDSVYSKFLSSTLTSILGWVERRLLSYHDTFDVVNINTMPNLVSIGISAAKILVEDISHDYRRKKKNEVDVARGRINTYIRSSLRTAFAQLMEKADSSRRASKNQPNPLPVLVILAKDVGELAAHEKKVFSPIFKRWHPLAAGVAVATLHSCYGNELKQFITSISELTPDAVQILRAADKLEQDLVQTAVEDSVDSDDGGKGIIREMPPYDAQAAIDNLVKGWMKKRLDRMKERVDWHIQEEVWNPRASQEGLAPSSVGVLRVIDETLDAFFQLPIPMHSTLLPDLVAGIDRCLQYYVRKAKSGCGSRSTYLPTMPALTRCAISKLGVFKKKEKSANSKGNSQVNGDTPLGVPQLCVRLNTFQRIQTELVVVEKKIITHLRNCESASVKDLYNGTGKKFESTPSACVEAIHQLSEAVAYKLIFHDLSHVLWDNLYVGDASSSRIEPSLQELEQNLLFISDTVNERIRTQIITDIMKASTDGFLLVLLAGGPYRTFTLQDSRIIEDDFKALKDLFWANGDRLPTDLINKCSSTAMEVLPLFQTDTNTLIERFRRVTLETYGSSAKSRFPLPPTSGQWNPTEPNTLLRVLCHRNDDAASKFLKKTYNLPKKL